MQIIIIVILGLLVIGLIAFHFINSSKLKKEKEELFGKVKKYEDNLKTLEQKIEGLKSKGVIDKSQGFDWSLLTKIED